MVSGNFAGTQIDQQRQKLYCNTAVICVVTVQLFVKKKSILKKDITKSRKSIMDEEF